MRKSILPGAMLAAALSMLYSGQLHAEEFAANGRVVIGAERITGVFIEKLNVVSTTTASVGGVAATSKSESTLSTTSVALLGSSAGFSLSGDSAGGGGPALTPRLGLDVFVASGLSVGGSLMFTTHSGSIESTTSLNGMPDPSPAGKQDQPSGNLLILAPRVGYGYAASPSFAIWPRAGLTYARYALSDKDETTDGMGNPVTVEQSQTLSFTDITLEFMLAVTPTPNVALLFGPYADIGLGGSFKNERSPDPNPGPTNEIDVKYTSFGLSAGIGIVL